MTKPAGLSRLLAEQEIKDLCYRYARGSDRLDAACFASAFSDNGSFNGMGGDAPIAAFAAQLVEVMEKYFSLTHHLNGNVLIDFVDEDRATTEVYFRAFHITRDDLSRDDLSFLIGERRLAELAHHDRNVYDISVGGRYLDEVECHDDVWKIKNRRLIFDYCTVQPTSVIGRGEGMTSMSAAPMARDRSDPSYLAASL